MSRRRARFDRRAPADRPRAPGPDGDRGAARVPRDHDGPRRRRHRPGGVPPWRRSRLYRPGPLRTGRAPLFAVDRRCHLVDLLQYGKSDKSPINGPRGTTSRRRWSSCSTPLDVDRADVVCNSWAARSASPSPPTTPVACVRSSSPARCPSSTGRSRRSPRAAGAGATPATATTAGRGRPPTRCGELMASLEWYDASRSSRTRRCRAATSRASTQGEMHLAAPPTPRGEWQDLEGASAGDPLPHPVRLGHARRLP